MIHRSTRIAILVSPAHGFGRELIQGIIAFARTQPNWSVRRETPSVEVVPWLRKWKPHGLITHVESIRLLRSLRTLDAEWLDLTRHSETLAPPAVWQDDAQVGRLVAEYFHSNGYREYAFVGYRQHQYSVDRQQGFANLVASKGGNCHLMLRHEMQSRPTPRRDWTTEQRLLSHWLLSLPKPVGLMACHDALGAEIVEVCEQSGIEVPEQVAVVGVEDDDLICYTTHPNLSSVRMPNESIGWHAARYMERKLAGKKPRPIVLPPIGVVTRGSSDRVASSDPVVAKALTYMREHIDKPYRVESVLEHVQVSQSLLERRFRAALGRTPLTEIRRLRTERAKLLLAETQLPMTQIARLCGFNSTVRFSTVFRELAGRTPSAYRQSLSPATLPTA